MLTGAEPSGVRLEFRNERGEITRSKPVGQGRGSSIDRRKGPTPTRNRSLHPYVGRAGRMGKGPRVARHVPTCEVLPCRPATKAAARGYVHGFAKIGVNRSAARPGYGSIQVPRVSRGFGIVSRIQAPGSCVARALPG